jgi:hypothetical protein
MALYFKVVNNHDIKVIMKSGGEETGKSEGFSQDAGNG